MLQIFFRRALTLILATGFGVFGIVAIILNIRATGLSGLGDEVIKGKTVSAKAAVGALEAPTKVAEGPTCRSDLIVKAGMISAAIVDAVVLDGDIEHVDLALRRLEHTARDILSCSPGQGMAWTWLAVARDQLGSSTDELVHDFERSQWSAPSELWVIQTRLPQVAQIASRRGRAPFENILRADIRTLLQADIRANTISDIMGPVFAWIYPITQSEFTRIDDPSRRYELMQSFGRWDANIAACTSKRFNDWLYNGLLGSCESDDKIPQLEWKKHPSPR